MTLPLVAFLAFAPTSDITFVRHGETVANATGRYNSRTLNVFSDKGQNQVAALTKRLVRQPAWDVILVSPSPRALRTIAPYLRATGRQATVWPLLYECCTGKRNASRATRLQYAGKVTIPADVQGLFQVPPGQDRLPNSPDWGTGLAQVDASVKELRAKYRGKRILLVGHSGHGGQLIHALTGKWKKVENATEIPLVLP